MAEAVIARDNVFIEDSVHTLYKELTDGTDLVSSPFRTMKEMFMWAATLGFSLGERRPLQGKKVMVFRWAQFSPQVDVPIIKAMAIAGSNDLSILARQDDMLIATEEYANRGILALRAAIANDTTQPLWLLAGELNRIPPTEMDRV